MGSDLVLLGKGGPGNKEGFGLVKNREGERLSLSVFQGIFHLVFFFGPTWYFEMIVKSAALSSNQAVGVKKSLSDSFPLKINEDKVRLVDWRYL